ncbi:MAG: SRPBCC family protein [Pseudomonadota bacterium]
MKDAAEIYVEHATMTFERVFAVTPERAFRAFADETERAKWEAPGEGWESEHYSHDFRPGGAELMRFGPAGDPRYEGVGVYADIVENRRIVSMMTMKESGRPISASVMTYMFDADPRGVRLTVTDQTAYFDGSETPSSRQEGWTAILDGLSAHLA